GERLVADDLGEEQVHRQERRDPQARALEVCPIREDAPERAVRDLDLERAAEEREEPEPRLVRDDAVERGGEHVEERRLVRLPAFVRERQPPARADVADVLEVPLDVEALVEREAEEVVRAEN